ncbi:RHS repeat-associated core domain-containing protein [Micromonospora sp. NPDC005806]|uniref:RHS repeat-associated core domain-containing protein n=1 Tax=Micromonospora sp. NPDC005806 TaxID=3364234 RepID=UPI0036CAC959
MTNTRWGRLLTAGMAAVMAVTVANELPARRAEAAPLKEPDKMLERPDEMAALITARMTGQRVKITNMTTDSAEYIAHPNGQVEATVHAGPVRMRRDNRWVPIDLTLQPAADGSVSALAHPLDLWISGARSTAGELAAVGKGDGRLSLGWPGALPAPTLNHNRATYQDVVPGIDLVVEATRTGFSEYLTVKDRAAVDRIPSLALPVSGKGLSSFTQDPSGGLTLTNAKGKPIAAVPAPEMWDGQRAPGSEEPTRRAVIATRADRPAKSASRTGGGLTMRLTPDLKWLKDPATKYPVTIDPQINPLYTSFDTYVKEGDTVDRSGANDLQLGLLAGSPNAKSRAFVHWPTSALAGKQITSATVNFWNFWSNTCTANSWEIWTTGAASSATRWGTQPTWIQKEATSTQTKGYSSACDDGWVSISGTSFFQRAATAGQSTAYMGVRGTDETTGNSFKQFRSRNAVDTSQVPYAVVTYNSYPTVGTRSTVPDSACVIGSSRPQINSLTPQLKAVISDGEASSVKAEFEWWTLNGTTKLGSTVTATGASGSTLSATVPSGALANGSTYKWRVRGNDGTVDGTWSSFCEFSVDTTHASPPWTSSPTYPKNEWGGDAGVPGVFTFDPNGAGDVAAYVYEMDVNPPTNVVNAPSLGAQASVTLTPPTAGWHTIYVRSRDSAGNLSNVRGYPFKVGSAAVTSPQVGDITAAKVSITSVISPTIVGVRYQWRRAGADTWTVLPTSDVTYAVGGGAVAGWPIKASNGAIPKVTWNVAATLAAADPQGIPRDGPLEFRGQYDNVGEPAIRITFDRNLASAATAEVGPGSVNLITGNYQISQPDVSVGGLSVGRTFNTRQAGGTDPLFGPGWVSGVLSAADAPYTKLTTYDSLVQVSLPDGSVLGFTKVDSTGATYQPQVGAEKYSLTYDSTANSFRLTDIDGNSATFTRGSTDPAGVYAPTAVSAAGSTNSSTYSWQKATLGTQDVMRPTRLLAPVPSGVTCSTMVRGCQALIFTYAAATTATGTAANAWGDYLGRVKEIAYTAWDPDLSTPAMRTVVLARYTYDDAGRLRAMWDPRLDYTDGSGAHSLRTVYDYDADGILTTVTPPAQEPLQFSYTTLPDDPGKGRLSKVTHSALAAGTAVETVVYRVPTSGTGAPYDLSGAQTARWAQTEPPTDATAVYPPTQVPTGDPAAGTLPSSYERATVTYLDANARTVNMAAPGGHITTTWYDQYGNVARELTPGNRQRALAAAPSDDATVEAQIAAKLATLNIYSSDGQQLLETFGPEHDVMLDSGTIVRGRRHTRLTYDEGAPSSGGPYSLPTTERLSVSYVNAGQTVDADSRTTTTDYDWTLRQPVRVTAAPGALDLVTRTSYDSEGRVVSTTTPAGGSVDTSPATRVVVYYTAAANASYAECGNRPEWHGLVCRTQTGGQPESGPELPATVTTYDMYGQPRVQSTKTGSGELRRIEVTYDSAGRQWESSVTAAGLGTALEKRRTIYDQANGQAVRTQTINGPGSVTAEIIRAYDSLGRMNAYTDADGTVTTSTFDIAGRPATVNDGKGTRTYTYDGGAERRGLPTSVADTQTGTFTGAYDSDGATVSQTWPNGLAVALTIDESGAATSTSYTKPGCGQTDCTLYTETVISSVHDQWRSRTSTLSGQAYTYDDAARLTDVQDTIAGQCTTRKYTFDAATNRTGQVTYGPGADGACQTTATSASQEWSYDSADRTSSVGYTYDALGRTLTQPAADSAVPGAAGSTMTYHVNDMVRSINQGTRTTTYTLDVAPDRIRSWTDTTDNLTRINHYSADGDSPSWTDEGGGKHSRAIVGLAGIAGVFTNTTGVVWQITNLHGDLLAGMTETGAGLAYTSEYDEHGNARNSADAGTRRYGWLGTHQRAADTPDGSILMGARLYNPATSRFNSVDSVYGGNANPYEYATGDSINKHDISGNYSCYRYGSSERKWYYWWGGWGGYRVDVYWQCYFTHNDTKNVTRLGFAYAIIAVLTWWAPPVSAAFGAAGVAIAWIAWEYSDKCSRKRGAYIDGTFRGYLTKHRYYSHGYAWINSKFCA